MLDHVTIGVSDLESSRAFYDAALAPLEVPVSRGADYLHWGALSIAVTGRRAATRRAHVAFAVRSRAHVDAFWRAATGAGGRDNGAPGLRPHYHERYYGAFVLDPDGNNIEAVFQGRLPGSLDHLSLRVRDRGASERFYETVLAFLGPRRYGLDDAAGFLGDGGDLWLYDGEPTESLHFAFRARTNADVDEFWRSGTEAGYIDNGQPGPRPQYHRGYYASFLLDPDGNNVEAVCHNRR